MSDVIKPTEEQDTAQVITEMKKGQSNIMVAVRLRPLWKKEEDENEFSIVKILDEKLVILQDPQDFEAEEVKNELRKNRTREKRYAFDYAFDETVSTERVFTSTAQFLCEAVLDGFNSTVFAYGTTGAGKTHTMLGNNEKPGIMYQTMQEIFRIQKQMALDRVYEIRISFLEIYNENIRDLTEDIHQKSDQVNPDSYLELREDPLKGVVVANLKEIKVSSAQEIFQVLMRGNQNRMVEATGANATSSRSHAVLQIICEFSLRNSGITGEIQVGKLSLIDLAGSERASRTNNRGQRMVEGANINRSLLSLGNCINALHENNLSGRTNYIPYRDSKLTRLLKDSLGGNCRTVMIANISPSVKQFEDTHNTLKYANRAKNIKTSAQRNVLSVEYHVSQYTEIINKLKQEVLELRGQLAAGGGRKISRPITSYDQKDKNEQDAEQLIQTIKDLIAAHFHQENKNKKMQHDLEQKIENLKFQIDSKNNEIDRITDPQSGNARNAINIKVISGEIDEAKDKVKHMVEQLVSIKRSSEDMIAQRSQLKTNWTNANLTPGQCELLNLIVREHTLQVNNLDALHKCQQQEMMLKIREAQQHRISEQLKLRDQIIKKALQSVDHEIKKPVRDSGVGHVSNRHDEVSPVARDVYRILNDQRIISLDELQKNSSSLPPIKMSPEKRKRGDYNEYINVQSRRDQSRASNLVLQLKNQNQERHLVKNNSRKYLMGSQGQDRHQGITINNDQIKSTAKLFEGKRSQPGLQNQPSMFLQNGKVSPRFNHKNTIEVGIQPLYARGQSKIGSGVNQPYSHQNIHQIAVLKSQFSAAHEGIQKSKRMKLGPGGGAYGALIGATKNSDESVEDANLRSKNGGKLPNYEEQKIRSSSVLSSGQQLQENLAILQGGKQRRVASGHVRDHQVTDRPDNWISPQKGAGHLSLLQQKALQFKNKLMSVGSTPHLGEDAVLETQSPDRDNYQ